VALATRVLTVTFTLPDGETITLNDNPNLQGLRLRVNIHKACLAIRNRASIEITNLSTTLREKLVSLFTAWNNRQIQQEGILTPYYIHVVVEAGYQSIVESPPVVTVFMGDVTVVNLTGSPPNVAIRIMAYTQQVDVTKDPSSTFPTDGTLYDFVKWAASEMGFGNNFTCETSYNDQPVWNAAQTITTVSAILPSIQTQWTYDIAAFVDDNKLIVKDRYSIIDKSAIQTLTEFIGIPSWTEWGMECVTLFDPTVKLAQGVILKSVMNPSLTPTYVVMELEYNLSSRDTEFYGKIGGSPAG
jgi:hypothetical protein